jgi:hypothetical protein
MVISFGLTNASVIFQNMQNTILNDLLDQGVIIYTDNILIYSRMEEKYDLLVKEDVKSFAEKDLLIYPEKCNAVQSKLKF